MRNRRLAAILASDPSPGDARRLWRELFDHGFSEETLFSLIVGIDNHKRGELILELVRAGVPTPTLRFALATVWGHDHGWLSRAFKPGCLMKLFLMANFPHPDLPPRITVYRGSHMPLPRAARGLSWTTDRSFAAWFACKYKFRPSDGVRLDGSLTDEPTVVRAKIFRDQVIAVFDSRGEDELIVAPRVAAEVDHGGIVDWNRLADDYCAREAPVQRLAVTLSAASVPAKVADPLIADLRNRVRARARRGLS